MDTTTNINQPAPTFGMTQFFLTGTLLLLGGLLAIPLYTVNVGSASLVALAGQSVAPHQLVWVSGGLWALEGALYFLLGWCFSRHLVVAGIALALGFLTRLVVSLLMVMLLSANTGSPVSFIYTEMGGSLWLLRVLAIATSGLMLSIPCRQLFASSFQRSMPRSAVRGEESYKHFSFKSERKAESVAEIPRRPVAPLTDEVHLEEVSPPMGFTPVLPLEGVSGMIDVPADLICASVPQARPFLRNEVPVCVELAYIVPQLPNATVWLTWQQIFSAGPGDQNYGHGPDRPDNKFQGRWIRIPARYYVTQVPRKYFAPLSSPGTVHWMNLPSVPQEQQFEGKFASYGIDQSRNERD